MSNQPKIPDPETRVRHIARLCELNKRMDKTHFGFRRIKCSFSNGFVRTKTANVF